MKRRAKRAHLRHVLAGCAVGGLLGAAHPSPGQAARRDRSAGVANVIAALGRGGLALTTDELLCMKESTSQDPVDRVVDCVSQEEAIGFVVRAWAASSSADRLDAIDSTAPPTTCLADRLRLATWPEVSEAVRAALFPADARGSRASAEPLRPALNAATVRTLGLNVVLAGWIAPYDSACGATTAALPVQLPPLTAAQLRVRWNAMVVASPSPFRPIERFVPLADSPETLGAPIAQNCSLSIVAEKGVVTGVNAFLHPPNADRASLSALIGLVAGIIEGRARARAVLDAIDLDEAVRPGGANQKVYIGHVVYSVGRNERQGNVSVIAVLA